LLQISMMLFVTVSVHIRNIPVAATLPYLPQLTARLRRSRIA
jgi:hypothetical protein